MPAEDWTEISIDRAYKTARSIIEKNQISLEKARRKVLNLESEIKCFGAVLTFIEKDYPEEYQRLKEEYENDI